MSRTVSPGPTTAQPSRHQLLAEAIFSYIEHAFEDDSNTNLSEWPNGRRTCRVILESVDDHVLRPALLGVVPPVSTPSWRGTDLWDAFLELLLWGWVRNEAGEKALARLLWALPEYTLAALVSENGLEITTDRESLHDPMWFIRLVDLDSSTNDPALG